MAYDNILLGHFDAANMVIRAMIENTVCLELIKTYQDEELWKYYLADSYRNTLRRLGKDLSEKDMKLFEEICRNYNIDKSFTEKRGKRKAYIDMNYGWTYKINNDNGFNFKGLCNLVNKREYDDFKFMSMYAHGTSVFLKVGNFVSIEGVINRISGIYIGLYQLMRILYCDCIDDEFEEVSDEILCAIQEYQDE